MADDAAGAVRRTPRPACDCEMFDFCDKCWGPEQQREAQIRQLAYCEEIIPSGPEDAEQCPNPREPGSIHCATHQRAPLPEVMHDAGETAEEAVRRLAAEVAGLRQNQRPVVLLRAEDCACPVGGDCSHGPEPVDALDLAVWLHAEAAWRVAGFDVLTVELARRNHQLTDERDEAVALCANLQTTLLSRLAELTESAGKARSTEWLRACATLPMEEWPPAPAYKGPMVPAADLDLARAVLAAVDAALHGLDSDLGDDATLDARVKELHESYLDMVQLNGRWIDEISQLKRDAVEVKRLDDEAYARHRDALYAALGCTGPEGSLIVLITENVAKVVAERDALQARIGQAQRACADAVERATTPEATQLPTRVLALLADPGTVHEVEVDDDGEQGDCVDDCVGCATDRGEPAFEGPLQGDQPADACPGCQEIANERAAEPTGEVDRG